MQEGVVNEKGKTLDEIHAEEARSDAELKAKKAAALAAAMEDEEEEADAPSILDAAEAMEPASEKAETPAEEAAPEEAPAEEAAADVDHSKMTVAELKELLKAAGKPVSGKKADLIARLNE